MRGSVTSEYALSVETDLAPGSPAHASGPRDGKWGTNWGGDEREFSRAGKMWYAFGMKGPAKYNQVWIESPRCTRGDNYRNEIGGDPEELQGVGESFDETFQNTGGNQATLYYLFACVGLGDFKPSDCPCERAVSVRVSYKYSATAQAQAEIIGGGICRGSRSSLASAVDLVSVLWMPDIEIDETPAILATGGIAAGRSCQRTTNWAELAIDLAVAGFYAYKALKKREIPILDDGIAWYYGNQLSFHLQNNLVNSLNNFIVREGTCGLTNELRGNLINGSNMLQLQTNKEACVLLQSISRVRGEVRNRGKANARILSSYGLTGVIQPSESFQAGSNCCRNGSAVYSLAHIPGNAAENELSLKQWVKGRFGLDAVHLFDDTEVPNIQEWGYRLGGVKRGCALQINQGGKRKTDSDLEAVESQYLLQRGDYLDILPTNQGGWILRLLDMNGRELYSEKGQGETTKRLALSSLNLPGGMYLGVFEQGATREVSKLVNLK